MTAFERLRLVDSATSGVDKGIAEAITPPHPDRPGVRLRVGTDKRGRFWLFEPVDGRVGHDAWRHFRLLSGAEVEGIFSLCAHDDLYSMRGPSGHLVVYHKNELSP